MRIPAQTPTREGLLKEENRVSCFRNCETVEAGAPPALSSVPQVRPSFGLNLGWRGIEPKSQVSIQLRDANPSASSGQTLGHQQKIANRQNFFRLKHETQPRGLGDFQTQL